jgi:hypothetical protein
MLGRLQMSVPEAIERYGMLALNVFSNHKISGHGRSKASKLEQAIKEIVQAKTGDPEALMMDPRQEDEVCRTYDLLTHGPPVMAR